MENVQSCFVNQIYSTNCLDILHMFSFLCSGANQLAWIQTMKLQTKHCICFSIDIMSPSCFHSLMPISSLPAETSCPQWPYVLQCYIQQCVQQMFCSHRRVWKMEVRAWFIQWTNNTQPLTAVILILRVDIEGIYVSILPLQRSISPVPYEVWHERLKDAVLFW